MITVVINGTSFDYPEVGDTEWGDAATNAFKALAGSTLQNAVDISDPTATNEFTLLNTLDLGGNYGVKVLFISSRSSNPAQSGVFRLSNNELVAWRNGNNDGDNTLAFDNSDNFVINGNTISFDVNGEMLVNGVQVTRSGEIVNADVAAAAGIEESKLALDHGTTSLYNNIETHKSNKTTAHGMDITTPVKDDTLIYDDIDSVWKNKPNTVDNLKNVNITSIQDGQILSYDLVNTEWKNTTNSIDNLSNVNITTIQDKQIISYDNVSSKWINTDNSVGNLSDTTITAPASGQVLTYDGNDSKWKNLPSASASLTGLTDTNISTSPLPSNGDVLAYDSNTTKWINSDSLTNHIGNTNNPHSTSIDNLTDSDIDSDTLAENDVLVFNDQTSKWENSQILVNHIGNAANPHLTTVAKLTDTTISTPANNDVLLYDYANSQWINSPIIEINDIANINTATTDVTLTASSKRHQIFTSTTGFTVNLPTTNIKAGEKFIFEFPKTVNYFSTPFVFAVGGSTWRYSHNGYFIYKVTALIDNPSTTNDYRLDAIPSGSLEVHGYHEETIYTPSGIGRVNCDSGVLFTLSKGIWEATLSACVDTDATIGTDYSWQVYTITDNNDTLIGADSARLGAVYIKNFPFGRNTTLTINGTTTYTSQYPPIVITKTIDETYNENVSTRLSLVNAAGTATAVYNVIRLSCRLVKPRTSA